MFRLCEWSQQSLAEELAQWEARLAVGTPKQSRNCRCQMETELVLWRRGVVGVARCVRALKLWECGVRCRQVVCGVFFLLTALPGVLVATYGLQIQCRPWPTGDPSFIFVLFQRYIKLHNSPAKSVFRWRSARSAVVRPSSKSVNVLFGWRACWLHTGADFFSSSVQARPVEWWVKMLQTFSESSRSYLFRDNSLSACSQDRASVIFQLSSCFRFCFEPDPSW